MRIEALTVLGGRGKDGEPEPVAEVTLEMGNVISVVGPTGSGKTALINDVELLADANTPSGRRILINGAAPPEDVVNSPDANPVAMITQHTNFLSDLPVEAFLTTHARVRDSGNAASAVGATLEFANQLTGEPIIPTSAMTELSGGQTRALLIADAVVIGNSPIILLDEIENAGIHRTRAVELLKDYEKIFIFVTHDPRIALLSDFRLVMRGGAMRKLIVTESDEKRVGEEIKKLDDLMLGLRASIRAGERLSTRQLDERLRSLGYIA
ncbi:MAG: ATP-binding cassette domain-containing protein [Candidatus Brocadiaceae bacterium]|nr:ATP-binding cassette domain-containing protein [Candidatus Brocadiaceae bacterium]